MRVQQHCSPSIEPGHSPKTEENHKFCPEYRDLCAQLILQPKKREEDSPSITAAAFAPIDWKDACSTIVIAFTLFATVMGYVHWLRKDR